MICGLSKWSHDYRVPKHGYSSLPVQVLWNKRVHMWLWSVLKLHPTSTVYVREKSHDIERYLIESDIWVLHGRWATELAEAPSYAL